MKNVNIAGRNIQLINNVGDGNTNINNSGSQTIEDSFNELREAIQKEYAGRDKGAKLQEVAVLEKEAKENPDKKSVIAKFINFAKDLASHRHQKIMTVIFTKIIPLLQEAAKHIKR